MTAKLADIGHEVRMLASRADRDASKLNAFHDEIRHMRTRLDRLEAARR